MAKLTMRQKFAKKTNEKAVKWLEDNGFKYPYNEARYLYNVPEYVITYFKHHKLKQNQDVESEPNT